MILMFSNLLSLYLPLIHSRHRNPHTHTRHTHSNFIGNDRQQEIELLILVFPEKKILTNLLNLFLFSREKVCFLASVAALLPWFIALYFSWLFASYLCIN
jgi:hypothetical protein